MRLFLMLGAGAVLLMKSMAAKTALEKMDFEFGGFKIHRWSLTNPLQIDTRLTINFINPARQAQALQALFVKIYYKGQLAGYVQQRTPQTILGQSSTPLTFPLTLNIRNLITEAPNIIKSRGQLKGVVMDGYMTTAGLQIPIKQTIDLGV